MLSSAGGALGLGAGGWEKDRAAGAAASRALQGEGRAAVLQTSEALMASQGQKYAQEGEEETEGGWCHGVCLSGRTWHHLTPCGPPWDVGFLRNGLPFGDLHGDGTEKGGKRRDELIQTLIGGKDRHTHTEEVSVSKSPE